jgi:tRNA threonylcarbamoyladenosine biosynthesis protein TsaB
MILLAFDTSTATTVVALCRDGREPLEARDDPRPDERPGHATRLLPLAAKLLAAAGIDWSELERIAVGVGPGTFTGLRVGLATAHGLAQSLVVPLVGVSSLRALALGGPRERPVLAAIDARRGEVFLAGYQGGMCLLEPSPVAPAALSGVLAGTGVTDWLAIGDGAVRYREHFERLGAQVPPDDAGGHRIAAPALCELATLAVDGEQPVMPDYLRAPDAQPAVGAVLR